MAVVLLQIVDTLADLKALQPSGVQRALLIGKATIADNLGGFYRWDTTDTTSPEDTKFMNIIPSSVSGAAGRWIRIFQKAKQYAQGIMVNNGGVKTMYLPGTTDSTGKCTIYLTDDNTATGNPLFTEVWQITPQQNPNTSNTGAPVIGYGVVSADLKTMTCYFSQSNSTTLGATLLSIAGSVIKGLTPVPSGVSVQVKVEGI